MEKIYAEAEPLIVASAEIHEAGVPEGYPNVAFALRKVVTLLALRGNRERAFESLCRAADAGLEDAEALEDDPQRVLLHGNEFDTLMDRWRRDATAGQEDGS